MGNLNILCAIVICAASVAHGRGVFKELFRRQGGTCLVDGVSYDPLEPIDVGNPCESCVCSEVTSRPECIKISCQVAPCVDAVNVPGMCCPICMSGPNCELDDGSVMAAGQNSIIRQGNSDCFHVCRCPHANHYQPDTTPHADCYELCGAPDDFNDVNEGMGNSNVWHPKA